MGKKKPQSRRRLPQFPAISIGGGGEGFSIAIIKGLKMDVGTTPPPPREATTDKSFPQSKLNGVENSPGGSPQSKLEGVDEISHQPAPCPQLSPQAEDCPQFFSHYSKRLLRGQSFEAQPHPTYPQFWQHPVDVVRSVRQLMERRGLLGTRELVTRYPLELILDAINAVDDMASAGVELTNPPGLILWRLERTAANGKSDG